MPLTLAVTELPTTMAYMLQGTLFLLHYSSAGIWSQAVQKVTDKSGT